VDKRDVFCDEKDYLRFLVSMREFNNESTYERRVFVKNKNSKKESDSEASESDSFLEFNHLPKLVEIICYCLNSNHYHLILRQLTENGITLFMRKLATGYTNHFNQKYNRSGVLFQGKFKSVYVDSNEYLLWLSGYINGNIEIHRIDKAENHRWSSYPDYLGKRSGTLCNKKIVLSQFNVSSDYKESRSRKDLDQYIIENQDQTHLN